MAYRDTFIQILYFIENVKHKNPDKMTLSDFNVDLIEEFLSWLETEKNNSISTRNQRLAAIRAFSKYVRTKYPEFMFELQKILDMRRKRCPKPELIHLSPEEIKSILEAVPTITVYNRRDLTLLSLLYDSAARVQEICDLRVVDVRVKKPYIVKLTGKGQKTRCVPLMHNTIELLKKYIIENNLYDNEKASYPLFSNHNGNPLTRAGVTYILKKHYSKAKEKHPELPSKISPHIFRHSKAMHLLRANVPLTDIRDFLGHEHVDTTEIYAKTDIELSRKKLEAAQITINSDLPDWNEDKSLMAMLIGMCGKS